MSEEIEVLSGTREYDKDAWYKSLDPNFLDICLKSRATSNWISYQRVLNGKFGNDILKPINNYASVLIPPPRLVSIVDNTVTLRYYTFADIYLQFRDGELYNVDRPWIRQYYMTATDLPAEADADSKTYKFYTPWFLDANIEVSYSGVEGSAFQVHSIVDRWYPVPKYVEFAHPHFVPFNFRVVGDHMRDSSYGVIDQPHPMFDVTFTGDDIILSKIEEFYAKHSVLPV